MNNLLSELSALLNCYSEENESNTPDFLLAEFLLGCLKQWNVSTQARDAWYGMNPEPGAEWAKNVPEPPRLPPSKNMSECV